MKTIPRASYKLQPFYPCHFCSGSLYPPDELFWSKIFRGWVCANCWSEHKEHWFIKETPSGVSFLVCDRGISLEEELKSFVYCEEKKLTCSDCSCEELLQPCEACRNRTRS
jgi:hypothetical protein